MPNDFPTASHQPTYFLDKDRNVERTRDLIDLST